MSEVQVIMAQKLGGEFSKLSGEIFKLAVEMDKMDDGCLIPGLIISTFNTTHPALAARSASF